MLTNSRGFTLIELLVALAIFSVTALVVLQQNAGSIRQQARLEDKTLATWVAENRLAELRTQSAPLSTGRKDDQVSFAGRDWGLSQEISHTSQKGLLKVVVEVYAEEHTESSVASLTGYIKER